MRDPTLAQGVAGNVFRILRVYLGGAPGPPRNAADTAVVLGAQVLSGGRPSGTLRARTLHAARLYLAGEVGRVVVTGGVGANPPAEAEVMARILVLEGVPESAVAREGEALNTWDSAVKVAAMARRMEFGPVVVVTDPIHCVRTASAFRRAGVEVEVEPVYESPMWRVPARRMGQFIRETGATVWYGIRHGVGSRFRL